MSMPPRLAKRWQIQERIPAPVEQALSTYPSFFRQILYNHGIRNDQEAHTYLDAGMDRDDPFTMTDMRESVDRILFAIRKQERIEVYGDYDVDGVTATALMVQVLRRLGAEVHPYIPNRFEEGYGLNLEAVESLAAQGVQLVVTVDCGIRSVQEAKRAEELGLDLIISDHHQPGSELPPAYTIICPKQPGDVYPDKDLSGVGLAYKISQALISKMPDCGFEAGDWLDLVALGTVADVVPLKGENRGLVRAGLNVMRRGQRPGLVSLANVARVNIPRIMSGDIGFILGPRLNAAGRLESALDSLNLLLADNAMEAGSLAQKLDNQNRQRQDITRKMQEEAVLIAQEEGGQEILFAVHPDFNEGVVGLAASRLVETFYRPAIVGRKGEEFTRASCRSIPEFHITHALDDCRDLLVRHGGHSMAAGFTIRNENLPELVLRLRTIAARELGALVLCPILRADLEIPLSELRPDLLTYLDQLQPTGQDNPEALFVSRGLKVVRFKTVGTESQHLRLTVSDGRIYYDGIAFRQGHWASQMPERVDLMYNYERNEFNGNVSLQLNIRDLKPAGLPD
jgi:single-stranded-DNA-specific exonuclease